MSTPLTFECDIHFGRRGKGARKVLEPGLAPVPPDPGRVPRVARLMALAIHLDGLLQDGTLASYREIAELGHVTRARASQIMALLGLAPDLQESVLHLPKTMRGRDPIALHELLPIAITLDWKQQRRMWKSLTTDMTKR
jgi:hypothetical protein